MSEEVKTDTAIETADSTETTGQTNEKTGMSEDDIKKLIQSEADKVRTEYSKKLKAAEDEKEQLKKAAMTEAEKAKYEKEQHEKSLIEKEKELTKKELLIEATDLLKESELDISFRKYVVGNDLEETKVNVQEFKKFLDARVDAEVNKRLKDTGRTPDKGTPSQGLPTSLEEIKNISDPKMRVEALKKLGY